MKETMLILHFIGLAMGLGSAFAHAFIGFATSKMSVDEATKLQTQIQILGTMGTIGLILLLVSGTYLIIPYWRALPLLPLLIAKLFFVFILILLIAIIKTFNKKALVTKSETQFKKAELFGKFALITSFTIVILAVLVFH